MYLVWKSFKTDFYNQIYRSEEKEEKLYRKRPITSNLGVSPCIRDSNRYTILDNERDQRIQPFMGHR